MLSNGENFWVVVLVKCGIPVSAEAFANLDQASECEKALRAQTRPESDEVGMFELPLLDLMKKSTLIFH